MKKIKIKSFAFLLALCSLITLLASCSVSKGYQGAPEGMRPCNEGDEGAILYVPTYWDVENSTGIPTAYYPDSTDKSMISMMKVDASVIASQTIPDYWNTYEPQIALPERNFKLANKRDDAGKAIADHINIGNHTVYIYEYSYDISGYSNNTITYGFRQALVKHPTTGDLFIITYSSPKATYQKHLADVDSVFKNIKFMNDGQTIPMEDKFVNPGFAQVENTPEGYNAISGEHTDYILFVPINWELTVNSGMTAARSKDDHSVTCTVTVFNLQSSNSYDSYFETLEKDLKETFGNVTFDDPENKVKPDVVGEREFKKSSYTVVANGISYKYTQYAHIDSGIITLLTLCCKSDAYASNAPIFDGIKDNFKFKD